MTKRDGGYVLNAELSQCTLILDCLMLFGWVKFHFMGIMGIETLLSEIFKTCSFIFSLLYSEQRESGCSFSSLSALGPASGTAMPICFWQMLNISVVCPSAYCLQKALSSQKCCCPWAWMIQLRTLGVFTFPVFLCCFFLSGYGTLSCVKSSQVGPCVWGASPPTRFSEDCAWAPHWELSHKSSRKNCSRERAAEK